MQVCNRRRIAQRSCRRRHEANKFAVDHLDRTIAKRAGHLAHGDLAGVLDYLGGPAAEGPRRVFDPVARDGAIGLD